MATVTSVPGTLDITPDPLQKQSKVQIRRNNKKGRIEIVTSTDSGSNYKTLLPEVTSKVQAGSIPVVQESGDVEWSVLSAKASTLTGVVSYINGGTGQASYAPGDILYANQQGVLSKLPIGSTDQLLTVNSALPAWQDIKLSDAVLSGLMKFKDPVRVATLTTEIYASGATAGNIPGLSTNTNLPATIDNIPIAVGDRILVKDQTTASQNGVYQRSVDTSKYLLKTIAVNASGINYSIGNSLTITSNATGDTAPIFSVTSLKVKEFTLAVPGAGVQAGTEYTLSGGTSTTPAKYKALTTKLTEISIESTYNLGAYDTEELKSLFLCNYFNSNEKELGNGKVEYKWRVNGAPRGSYRLKGMVYSPAAAVSVAANSGKTSINFNNLTGTDYNTRKGVGIASSASAIGVTTISFKLSQGVIPGIGDIVSLSGSFNINYTLQTLTDTDGAAAQFDAYLVTAITGPIDLVYTITLHTAITKAVTVNKAIRFTAKALNDSSLRGFLVSDKFTLGLSATEYTITDVTQSRTTAVVGGDSCKLKALSGLITFTPALTNDVPVNTTIRYIGKAVPGTNSNSYPIKSRSTAFPSSASFPLNLAVVDVGLFSASVTAYSSILNQSTSSLLIFDFGDNINATFPSGTSEQIANNDLRLVPKCGVVSGQITDPGVFTLKPSSGKLIDTGGSLGISFSPIVWAVNAVSITNGGVLAANTRAEFDTAYVSGGESGGSGLTLNNPTYEHLQAVFSRIADADTWAELSGSAFKVTAGTANGGSIYFCDSRSPTGVIGTTGVNFTKIAGITEVVGGAAIANSGTGNNLLQDEPILNDPVIKIRVAQSGGGNFSFGASTNYDSYTLKLPILGTDDTIVARNTFDVLTNKSLVRPFITSINTGPADGYFVSTLPQQTTTLVGTDTTDTLTNKTIESSVLTGDTTLSSTSTFTPAAGATLDLSAANVILPSSTLSGFGYKAPVRAATTANITLSGIQTIDTTVTLVAGDRVLVKNQSTAYDNGIYIVSASTWTRSADLNVWSEASAAVVVVQEGTLNQDTVWLSTANASGTIGSTDMPWGMIGVDQTGFGLTTQVLVGGGENIKPAWTTATGTGAPVRAGSPTFTGTPSLPTGTTAVTQSANDNTTALATTAFVTTANNLKANLASPTFTGNINFGGHILPSLDNSYDIGQSASPRIRNIYCVGIATMQYISCASQAKVEELADYGNLAAYMKTAYDSTHDFYLFNRTTTHIPLSINAVTSQTADLFHCYVNAVQKFAVSTSGTITLAGGVDTGGSINIPATTATAGQITQAGARIFHTFGSQNLFIGKDCGNVTTLTGESNVVVSREGFKSLIGGARNTGIGDGVSLFLTTGYDNTLAGCFVAAKFVSASENVAMGKSALAENVSSHRNTAIGMNALGSCIGGHNIGLGFNAGYYITGTANIDGQNTCLGNISGVSEIAVGGLTPLKLTTGTQNTFVGFAAGSTSNSSLFRTAIGAFSVCQSDNAIKLGRDYSAINAGDKVIFPSFPTVNLPTADVVSGMVVNDSTINTLKYYNGTAWNPVVTAATLTGATLASNVLASSLTSVGMLTSGTWNATVIAGEYGGTGIANAGKTITLGGNLTTSGAHATTLNTTGITSVTLPTSGTLVTQTALDLKANLASPTFTGTPLSTTAPIDTNNTQIATTAYVIGQGYAKLTGVAITPTTGAFSSTTASTTTTTGAVTVAGGLGVAGRGNFGEALATGTASTIIGTIRFYGTGTGSILLTPPAGNLGTPTLTLPTESTTLAGLNLTQTFNVEQIFSSLITSNSTQDTSSAGAAGAISTFGGLRVAKQLYVGTFSTFMDHAYFAGEVQTSEIRATVANSPLLVYSSAGTKIAGFESVGDMDSYVTIENGQTSVHIYADSTSVVACGLHLRGNGGGFVNIEDSTDTTKCIKFDPSSQSTATIATIKTFATADSVYTIPNSGTGGFLMDNSPYISANFLDWVSQTAVTIGASATASISFGAANATVKTRVLGTLEYTSSTSAALIVSGGVYIGKKIQCNSSITCAGTANSFGATTVSGNFTYGAPISTPAAQTATTTTSAVSITTHITALTCSTASSVMTLANGTNGQTKIIQAVNFTGAGTATITPTTKTGFTTITFTAIGNTVTLCYHTTIGWMVVANYGCTID